MLVVIPTYKRNACLEWVLRSLVQCDVDGIQDRVRILVVNNLPSASEEIRGIVDRFKVHEKFEWNVLYRKESLPPVRNWYSAICEYANENEIICLQGDDDLFMSNCLVDRHNAFAKSNCDMLLTLSNASRLIMDPSRNIAIPLEIVKLNEESNLPDEIRIEEIEDWTPAFIGNHAYRYNKLWRNALKATFELCDTQDFLDENKRTLMLPYYLPYVIADQGGKLSGLKQVCVVRGGEKHEIIFSRFGVSGWNSGFLYLCAFCLLSNPPFKTNKRLDRARNNLRELASDWYLTFFLDPTLSRKEVKQLARRSSFKIGPNAFIRYLNGLRMIIGDKFGVRRSRMNSRFKSHVITIDSVLDTLK